MTSSCSLSGQVAISASNGFWKSLTSVTKPLLKIFHDLACKWRWCFSHEDRTLLKVHHIAGLYFCAKKQEKFKSESCDSASVSFNVSLNCLWLSPCDLIKFIIFTTGFSALLMYWIFCTQRLLVNSTVQEYWLWNVFLITNLLQPSLSLCHSCSFLHQQSGN